MSEDYIIRDDVSRYGLGRLHVMRAGLAVDAEIYLDRLTSEGCTVEAQLAWHDATLDNHHLYIAWRYAMGNYPMWGRTINGNLVKAAALAAAAYQQKHGIWPNIALVRVGTQIPAESIRVASPEGNIVTEMRIITERWPRSGDVLVCYQEAGNESKSDQE